MIMLYKFGEHQKYIDLEKSMDLSSEKDKYINIKKANYKNIKNTLEDLFTSPRVAGSKKEKEIGIKYADIFKSYGYEVGLQSFLFKNLSLDDVKKINKNKTLYIDYKKIDGIATNIVASKKGKNPNGEILIISAHYDSESITNGVIDNATGVSALMELAYMLKDIELDNEIRFILFSGEENFMYGSRYYVSKLSDYEKERITNINIDSIGEVGELKPILGTINSRKNDATKLFDKKLQSNKIDLVKGPPSDYLAFEYINRPAVTIAQYPSKHMRTVEGIILGDKIERVDIGKIQKVVDMVYEVISENY